MYFSEEVDSIPPLWKQKTYKETFILKGSMRESDNDFFLVYFNISNFTPKLKKKDFKKVFNDVIFSSPLKK